MLKRFKDALGDRVLEVRVSERLRESPACLVRSDADLSAQMRRVLASAGQTVPASQPVLELNVTHPLVRYMEERCQTQAFEELARLLYDEAELVEEGQIGNPSDFSRRLNQLLVRLIQSGAQPPSRSQSGPQGPAAAG